MDGYPQAKQILTAKNGRAIGLPFLTQYQLGGIILGLALGYGLHSFWMGFICLVCALIGLAVYQGELVAIRLWYMNKTMLALWLGRPISITFPSSGIIIDEETQEPYE